MSKKIYSNIELKATPVLNEHLVNLGTVKNLINKKVTDPVRVVDLVGIEGSYDSSKQELTETVGSALKIDGVSLQVSDRVLLANQLDSSQNGLFDVIVVGTDGTPASASATSLSGFTFSESDFLGKQSASATLTYDLASTSWQVGGSNVNLADYGITSDWTASLVGGESITITYTPAVGGTPSKLKRSSDYCKSSQITPNTLVPVSQGSNADKLFMLTNDGSITLDTDALHFIRYSSSDNATEKFVKGFIGDGVATEFTIQHALNTKDIEVSFHDATGNPCYFNYELTSENVITVKSDVVLKAEDGEFKVTVIG